MPYYSRKERVLGSAWEALSSGHSFELYFDGANANTFEFYLRKCSLHFSLVFNVLFISVCVQVCMCHGVQCGGLAGVTSFLPPCELLEWSWAISPVQQTTIMTQPTYLYICEYLPPPTTIKKKRLSI